MLRWKRQNLICCLSLGKVRLQGLKITLHLSNGNHNLKGKDNLFSVLLAHGALIRSL